jgi:glycosyltransferase involved in cell wall biosynthesis
MKLSGVIITFNEARNIGRCLASLQAVCDNTAAICASFGVRFEQHSFEGHIQQKNEALQRATHPWILSLDADEALTPELQAAILEVKAQSPQKGAFKMNRLTNYCGKWIHHSGWYPDTKLRLASKANVIWGGINPHDQLLPKEELQVGHLKGDLLHYSYYTKADHFKQIDYFSKIAANELFERKVRCSLMKLYLKVMAQFLKSYLVKKGFLDGKAGWFIALRSAYATQQKYTRLRQLWSHA